MRRYDTADSKKLRELIKARGRDCRATPSAGSRKELLGFVEHDGPLQSKAGELVHHSDRGSQYLSIRYTERLAAAGIEPSVGSVGDSYDNALAESVIGLYKTTSTGETAGTRSTNPYPRALLVVYDEEPAAIDRQWGDRV